MIREKKLEIGSLRKFLFDEMKAALKPVFHPRDAIKSLRSGDPYNLKRFKTVEEDESSSPSHKEPSPS